MSRKDSTLYYTDHEINELLKESKSIANRSQLKKFKEKRGWLKESKTEVKGANGNGFLLIINNTRESHKPFSIILAVELKNDTGHLNLVRYDGFDQHKNHIENEKMEPGCHIHTVTEHYQKSSVYSSCSYAEHTTRFDNAREALECLINDCNITFEEGENQSDLF